MQSPALRCIDIQTEERSVIPEHDLYSPTRNWEEYITGTDELVSAGFHPHGLFCGRFDSLARKEARAGEKRFASLPPASKRDRPYSEMACFVKTWMSLSIVPLISMLLRGSRSSAWKRRPPDDGVAACASVTSQKGSRATRLLILVVLAQCLAY
ncbi:hypothetical protein THAOC_03365 [Thalassiosira oceanica]|uniref:Uncharacterized protein n=1 Tax=Thalassiosira oceanica TaxID=159749 RepID=K0TCL0_THAOC|nr:hypothetical protein THAOC_03365 [Thalassiosira oceanica]|eukprot:EJK74929.1 hypothetical protein THAOC_03365 [Thalassiosira oceanica]